MIKKHVIKSCCGGTSYLFETDIAVQKSHLSKFEAAGFSTLPHFAKAGIFYVQIKGLIATASFGTRKIQVKASGQNIEQLLQIFEDLLNTLSK